MKRTLKISALVLVALLLAAGATAWYVYSKQPQRSGTQTLMPASTSEPVPAATTGY